MQRFAVQDQCTASRSLTRGAAQRPVFSSSLSCLPFRRLFRLRVTPKRPRHNQPGKCACTAAGAPQELSEDEVLEASNLADVDSDPETVYNKVLQLAAAQLAGRFAYTQTPKVQQVANNLLKAAARHAATYSQDDLISILQAAAGLHWRGQDNALPVFEAFCSKLEGTSNSACSRAIWAAAKLSLRVPVKVQQAFLQHVQPGIASDTPRVLALTCWALATLGWQVPQEWRAVFFNATLQQLPQFKSQDFANVAWGVAKLGWASPQGWVSMLCSHAKPQLEQFKLLELSGLAWALVRIQHSDPSITAAISRSAIPQVRPVLLSHAPAALQLARFKVRMGLQVVALAASPAARRSQQRSIASLAWAMAGLQHNLQSTAPTAPGTAADFPTSGAPAAAASVSPSAASAPSGMQLGGSDGLMAEAGWASEADVARAAAADVVRECLEALEPSRSRSQGIANVLWAASAVGVRPAETKMEQVFAATPSYLATFTPAELSMLLLALVRMGLAPPQAWLAAAAESAAARFTQYKPRDYANVMFAFGKLGYQPDGAWLEAFLLQSQPLLGSFSQGDLSSVLGTLSGLERVRGPAKALMREWCNRAVLVAKEQLDGGGEGGVASTTLLMRLLGMAPAGARDPALVRDVLREAGTALPQASTTDLCAMLCCAAQIRGPSARSLVTQLVSALEPQLPGLAAQGCADAAWALGALGYDPGREWAAALHARSQQLLETAGGWQLAVLLWGLVRMGYPPGKAWMGEYHSACLRELDRCSNAEVAMMLWAVAHCDAAPAAEWVASVLAEVQPRLPGLKPEELCGVMTALARLQHRPQRPWLDTFLEVSRERFWRFSGRELANCSWALGVLRPPESDGPWLVSFLGVVQSRLPAMAAVELAGVLWGLAELGYVPSKDWMYDYLEAVNRVMKREPCQRGELGMIQSALAKMGDAGFQFV